ncbi:nucleoside transporter C-terminal domain-containing protein [Rapidithrix thailandica]|uniref:Nucleoside transporter C-terminal domain-containing protein n=1 Tax=Rapidithrix thailandica TaxID=413964 RepID=A0AAW9SB74_9BACT
MDIIRGAFGLCVLIGIAWLFSKNKSKVDWRLVITGVFLQITFGVLITQIDAVAQAFHWVSKGFVKLLSFTSAGSIFLFGDLANGNLGNMFAFQILPTILFFSTVSAALYYLGVLQKIVKGIAWVMAKTMKLSGAESLSAAGNIFLGQTEAPLLVKPFINKMTSSELMCLMTGGMATIAGGVLAAFVVTLGGDNPEEQTKFAAYLLSASIMNAPAAIVMAKMIIPETQKDLINQKLEVNSEQMGVNLIDALSRGAADGLKLALNVGGMLLAFTALIALMNYFFKDILGDLIALSDCTLNQWIVKSTDGAFNGFTMQYIFGQVFRLLSWTIGVEWSDTLMVGSLIGEKTVVNEFFAYERLGKVKELLSPKSVIIATYALCGFSNFSSIAIQIGGIGGMAPQRQSDLSQLGMRALLAATLACLMTATIAGMII